MLGVLPEAAILRTGCTSTRFAPGATPGAAVLAHVSGGWLRGAVAQGARELLGVPCAAPPMHDLRFAAPRPARPWLRVRSATVQGPACVQFQPTGVRVGPATTKCYLYLHTYAPTGARPGSNLPVLFWIRGGNFACGSGVFYGGQRFASLANSVVVSIYWLGPYGFLSLPVLTAASPQGSGNYGLARPWVTGANHPVIDFHPGDSVSATVFTSERLCHFWATSKG